MRPLFSSSLAIAAPLCLLLSSNAFTVVLAQIEDHTPSDWYTKYTKYPEYCSTPAMMAKRTIPPLKEDSRLGETRLVHVTASIRHGARTPTEGGFNCWEGYWQDQGIWDCDLKAEMAPPTPFHEKQQEQQQDDTEGYSSKVALFEKSYDALMHPEHDLSNSLLGTCQTGQLLLQGYEQHTVNGQILREAYTYDGSTLGDHDPQMRLLDRNEHAPWVDNSKAIYLRSDDDSRVLMSGQVLLRSMWEPEIDAAKEQVRIPVHLADRSRDIVAVNEQVCPRLTEMRETLEKTPVFKGFNASKEAREIRKFMKNQLKAGDQEIDILGCLMPVVCTDKSLPDAFEYESSDMFDRMMNFAYKRWNLHIMANDAEYAKLAMAPLWSEIMDKIKPVLNRDEADNKLLVVSGHDDTIAPLMATLGVWNDTAWPAYASMFLIEIHEIIDGQTDHRFFASNFAFRLVYNGQVITNQVKGCLKDSDLCDVFVFTDIVEKFATRDRNCQRRRAGGFFLWGNQGGDGGGGGGIWVSFLLVLVGAVGGGMVTSYSLTGRFWGSNKSKEYDTGVEATINNDGTDMPTESYTDNPAPTSYQDEGVGKNLPNPYVLNDQYQ